MTSSEKRKIFTVARLNQEVQQLLERGFGTVWLQAELSNFSQPASGHWYFSLKDSQAQMPSSNVCVGNCKQTAGLIQNPSKLCLHGPVALVW